MENCLEDQKFLLKEWMREIVIIATSRFMFRKVKF